MKNCAVTLISRGWLFRDRGFYVSEAWSTSSFELGKKHLEATKNNCKKTCRQCPDRAPVQLLSVGRHGYLPAVKETLESCDFPRLVKYQQAYAFVFQWLTGCIGTFGAPEQTYGMIACSHVKKLGVNMTERRIVLAPEFGDLIVAVAAAAIAPDQRVGLFRIIGEHIHTTIDTCGIAVLDTVQFRDEALRY